MHALHVGNIPVYEDNQGPVVQNFVSLILSLSPHYMYISTSNTVVKPSLCSLYIDFKSKHTVIFC